MQDFLIFYAPFIVLIASIVVGFWISLKDGAVTKDEQK
ncbi:MULTISPECIES: cytochrome bd oxidase small subunit CydS [unclassified Planococcus (in: firmicutes)]